MFFFFKQKTAYDMRISDWSSDVCSSDLNQALHPKEGGEPGAAGHRLDTVKAARRIEDRVAGRQRDTMLAIGIADGQPPALIIAGIVEEEGAGQVGTQMLVPGQLHHRAVDVKAIFAAARIAVDARRQYLSRYRGGEIGRAACWEGVGHTV